MFPFLQSVAEAYASHFRQNCHPAPLDYCFVFPNKRAGTFFLNHLRKYMPDDTIAPAVTTISDLVADLSGRLQAQRIDLLFLLYKCYSEGRSEAISFDSFRRWGDTVLKDFNEVDMQIIDPDAIFKNVADFRRISSTFLTPEQRVVMEEYFGYSPANYDDSKFWQDFDDDFSYSGESLDLDCAPNSEGIGKCINSNPTCANEMRRSDSVDSVDSSDKNKANIRKKFVYLWKIMGPLYHSFHKTLAERGLTTTGGAYRLALENLEAAHDAPDSEEQIFRLLPYKKVVMVGFNALSMSERAIFSILRRLPSPDSSEEHLTDFVWDATGPILTDRSNSAGRFVTINAKEYPSPQWIRPFIRKSDTSALPPVIENIAAPSKVMQIKIATSLITDLLKEKGIEIFREAKVALVVPDESLLLPLLYSIPKEIEEVNLTMGYPLRLTAVNSFLSLLRSLQLAPRNSKSYSGFAYEQVKDLLSHPYSHAIFSTDRIRRFCKSMERRHVSVVRDSDFSRLGNNGLRLLHQLDPDSTPDVVIAYLDEALTIVEDSLNNKEQNMAEGESILKGKLEKEHIRAWREALRQFAESIREYGIQMNTATTLAEAYRLVRGESVAFEGEPLRGLQIMGMLETRALDFDYLYIVGLNDRTIPGRGNRRSFIPNIIRRGFGMPPNTYQEELFGYYFFRLLSRTQSAHLIYDNRVGNMGSGGESRYLLQLKYIYARDHLKNIEYKFALSSNPLAPIEIEKNERVIEALERYSRDPQEDERRFNLSPSLLKKYTSCPLKFYFSGILDFGDDPEPTPAVDPITYGKIVHEILQFLYLPDKKDHKRWLEPAVFISADYLRKKINDEDRIRHLAQRAINKYHYQRPENQKDEPLEPDTELIAEGVVKDVKNVLTHDLLKSIKEAKDGEKPGFYLHGVEIDSIYNYFLPDGRRVNMRYTIDRIDSLECENSGEARIIDYKTGKSHIEAESVEDLVSDNYKNDNLLQLVIYSQLANLHREDEGKKPLDFLTRIYPVSKLDAKSNTKTYLKTVIPYIGGEFIEKIGDTVNDFSPIFEDLLAEIFNPDIPFRSKPSEGKCNNCIYQDVCRSARKN